MRFFARIYKSRPWLARPLDQQTRAAQSPRPCTSLRFRSAPSSTPRSAPLPPAFLYLRSKLTKELEQTSKELARRARAAHNRRRR